MAAVFVPRSRAAAGRAGTNICMAVVPVTVINTNSQSGGLRSADANDTLSLFMK